MQIGFVLFPEIPHPTYGLTIRDFFCIHINLWSNPRLKARFYR